MSVKTELIRLFTEKKGEYLSGEELAERLSCTRAAVWKAVEQLRKEGYEIAAAQNRGYMLSENNDLLSAEELGSYLGSGKQLRVYPEISSTNDVLKGFAVSEGAPAGTTILSDLQTGGKGRLGRRFFSPKGCGLYMSMLLRPEGSVTDNLILTAQSAVAVYRAVKRVCGIELGIKWVNDLYFDGRKVCGILSEGQANFETGKLDFVIVGIGLNVYEPEEGYPEELQEKAGSLLGKRSAGARVNRNLLAAELIREFYRLSQEQGLAKEYSEKNIVPGHRVRILDRGTVREADALRILPDGRLEVMETDGTKQALVYGEVSVRFAEDFC